MKSLLSLVALAVLFAGLAAAGPITVYISGPHSDLASAEATRAAWLGTANWTVLEDFESFTAAFPAGYTSLATGIGTFQTDPSGQGSAPGNAGTGLNEFVILNSALTPFAGRFNTTPGGANWLDSNDITNFYLSVGVPTSTLFFFMTDAEDVGAAGQLRITARDAQNNATSTVVSTAVLGNGAIHFVGIQAEGLIEEVRWLNGQRNDGFGVDQFGAVVIPEPASFFLLGSALLGAGLYHRRRKA